jgi:hypothetical protein
MTPTTDILIIEDDAIMREAWPSGGGRLWRAQGQDGSVDLRR